MKLTKFALMLPAVAMLATTSPQPAEARSKTILKYGAIGLGAAALYQAGRNSHYGGGYYGGGYHGGYAPSYYSGHYSYPSYGYAYPSYSYYPSYGYGGGYYGGGYYY